MLVFLGIIILNGEFIQARKLPLICWLGQEYIPSADLENCHAPRGQGVFAAGRLALRGASRSWYVEFNYV